ncbi:MAG TPA: hypothetical protein VKZ80_05495 [Flavobacterium sp.]|jgi:thiol-disulfide isomerase/thioredoxin|nr:hypothetical protein [Flavobacterium sp.]
MKRKNLILFVFFISLNICSQTPLKSTNGLNYNEIINDFENNIKSNIYSINKDDILQLVKLSKKKYHILYSFATWCGPCREYLPNLLRFIAENDDVELYILLIEKNNSRNLLSSKIFFDKMDSFNKPLFCIVGNKPERPKKLYFDFVKSILPHHKEYGLSLNILMLKNGNILYASTYNESKSEIIENLKRLTVNPKD